MKEVAASGAGPGKSVIDMSSIAPLASREIDSLLADHCSLVRHYEKMARIEVKR